MCVCVRVKVLERGAHFPICPSLFALLMAVMEGTTKELPAITERRGMGGKEWR